MKKGFTLIELLAVIVILAIISIIAVPIVLHIIKDTKLESYKISLSQIEHAGDLYHIENPNTTTFNLEKGKLVNANGDILTFDGDLGETSGVRIMRSGNIYTYYYKDGYCTLRRGLNSEVEQFKTDKELCNIDVATNLVKNGYGEYKDNTNFSNFKYNGEYFSPIAGISSFAYTQDNYIKVDTNKKYYISAYLKYNYDIKYYSGISEYDIDKLKIGLEHDYNIKGTLTYLTEDLKNGDSVVHLYDISNFIIPNNDDNNDKKYSTGLIFWNYKDSTGYLYPENTYSRNSWTSLYDENGLDKVNNTITLKSVWNHGTFKAGTKVGQSRPGQVFNYALQDGSNQTKSEWEKKESYIEGVNGDKRPSYGKFANGTNYIRYSVAGTAINTKEIIIREVN